MADKIRWGVLATGGIAATFTEDLRTLPDADVVAVGSRSLASARAFADRFDIPRAHGSWQELAEDPDVDVVYVANTHNAHFPAAELMLRAGKNVLCEKAFTLNLGQAQALIDLARDRGVFLMEAMWMRTNPAFRRMLEMLADGAIGEISTVHADFHLAGPFAADHRLRDPQQGGGALLDLGVYPVTFAHAVLGVPSSVTAWSSLNPEGTDANTGMLFGYAHGPHQGALAALTCGITADSPVRAAVSGSRGRIVLDSIFFRPEEFTLHRAGADPQTIRVPFTARGMVHEAVEVMRCLREGLLESPLVSWQDTLDVMALLDGVRAQVGVVFPGER
ncbi:MAG: Gfo/Idh/MocA family oxidoreductase [Hamadaea sp.]|nr:Gfo/Idh/MocA family oxidoreductase [Hamadaea sp.]NUR52686.1 Gfo/Idh/MocA family oxidoreductase [Hamadaea sp.]NUT03178.1 Gfo/Idh/MocA family oxidoreductase [Hamadaea sp.]